MDQDAVVTNQTEGGKRLIEALATAGFSVQAAFWAKPTEDGKWFLYLASPAVDEKGPAWGYRCVLDVLRQIPDLGIDPFEVKVIGLNDSLAQAALAATSPKVAEGPFAVRKQKPYPGMIRFGGSVLGGVSIDEAYIYPPSQPAA
jgi:hypothetical protein